MSDKGKKPVALDADRKGSKDNAWWQPALILFFRFSGWIAAPVLLGALIGNWLDSRYNNENSFYIFFSVGFSFIISIFGLVKEVGREYKRIEEEEKEKKGENKPKV
ncbi:MAG: AtpZ/AtpI family protein [Patescibacteria group bacterium]|jgi:hypothetical protein